MVGNRFALICDKCYEEHGVAESRDVDVAMPTTKDKPRNYARWLKSVCSLLIQQDNNSLHLSSSIPAHKGLAALLVPWG